MGRPVPAALARALDARLVEPTLAGIARRRFGGATELRTITAELVKRRVVRYTAQGTANGEPMTWRVIGKVYESEPRGQLAFATHRALWQAGFAGASPAWTSIPEVYDYVPDGHTLLMEDVGGRTLKRLLKTGEAQVAHLRLFGSGLAKLHRFPWQRGAPFTIDDHLEHRCAGLTGAVAQSFPDLAGPIEKVVAIARRRGRGATTLAHGDYHPGQVLISDDRLWILDLDPLHDGDPAYDLAMVFVMLKLMGAGRGGGDAGARARWEAFLGAYFEQMELENAGRIPIHAALILLKRACKRFRWQDEPNWRSTVVLQVRRAAQYAFLQETRAAPESVEDVVELFGSGPEVA